MQSYRSTTYGHGGGLQTATKEAPRLTRKPGVQVGREKSRLPPFKPLSNTTRRLQEYILCGSPGQTGILQGGGQVGGGHGQRKLLAFSIPRRFPSQNSNSRQEKGKEEEESQVLEAA